MTIPNYIQASHDSLIKSWIQQIEDIENDIDYHEAQRRRRARRHHD